jgi:hypothetical protein
MKKLLYVCLMLSFSSFAEVKPDVDNRPKLSRFRAPASIIEREHLAQRAEKNIARPKLKVEKKLVNPPTELPVRVKQLTPGGTSE